MCPWLVQGFKTLKDLNPWLVKSSKELGCNSLSQAQQQRLKEELQLFDQIIVQRKPKAPETTALIIKEPGMGLAMCLLRQNILEGKSSHLKKNFFLF